MENESKEKPDRLKCLPPFIFAIPRPYEDDYERNSQWYKEMLKLEKKSLQLKLNLEKFEVRHTSESAVTKLLIEKAKELNDRFINKSKRKDTGETGIQN